MGHDVELGEQWVSRFLHRHPQLSVYHTTQLSVYHATPLEWSRANGMNPTAVKEYFDTVAMLFNQYNPPEENILAMDEVGIKTGIFTRTLVIAQAGQRHQHLQKTGECKITTCIETIAGNGTTLQPTVIFKGKYCMSTWSAINPNHANVTVSAHGYTDNPTVVDYIINFHEQTKHLKGPRFLFLDGHRSHCSLEFLEFAVEHDTSLSSQLYRILRTSSKALM
ncbi:hypothetical protein FRB90_004616 [Tulasnella sp. 427]|nr:hypothetical protein FRB90_004616 [Tulasnella sp. 427]